MGLLAPTRGYGPVNTQEAIKHVKEASINQLIVGLTKR